MVNPEQITHVEQMALFLTLSISLNAGKVSGGTNIFSNSTIKTDFAHFFEHWLI